VADGQAAVGVEELQAGGVDGQGGVLAGGDGAAGGGAGGPDGFGAGDGQEVVFGGGGFGGGQAGVLDRGGIQGEQDEFFAAQFLGDAAVLLTSCASAKFIAGEPMNPATNRLTGAENSTWGVSACCRRPSRSTATRWPSVIASTWSWVTYTVVTPSRACSWASEARIETRSLASRFDSGSSTARTPPG
jgi:hypothetical protein